MKIIEKIFPNGGYFISSGWGERSYWYNGKLVNDFHNGIDYATSGKKLPQYAVEDGYIVTCGVASDGANFIWVAYPRIGKKFLHYHLDSISVSKGQSVCAGTLLGYTGTTGQSTGIHLHLGMKDINGGDYQNVENYNYELPTAGVKYLNLSPTVSSWTVYKTNNYYIPSRASDVRAKLNPKKFGGLTYKILQDMGNYHFKIKTDMFGEVYIAGNPNKYSCTISNTPAYNNGSY